jgi:FkbM family methyltransferase
MRWLSKALGGYRTRLIERLIPEVARSQDEIDQLGKQVVRTSKEMQQLGQHAESRRQEIEQLGHQVLSDREEIERLLQQIEQYRQDITQLGGHVGSNRDKIEQLGHQAASDRQETDQLGQRVVHYRQEIDQLGREVVHYRQEIDQLGQEFVHHRKYLSDEVARHSEEIDQLVSKCGATADAEARYRKEARCRQLISSAIARYFVMGERSEDASIRFEDVKVDSDANWIPEILGRAELSEPEFMVFKHFDQDTGTILDIGANYGYAAASMWAAGATSKILSFEPNPWHRPCLLRIKEMRPALFDFIHLALGSTDSWTRFIVPVIEGIGISALSSAAMEAEMDWGLPENLVQHMIRDHPGLDAPRLQFTEVTWHTERLDDVLPKYQFDIQVSDITAMKIDVEGFEAAVLAGAVHTLRAHKPLIMIEGANRNADVIAWLSPLGYSYADFVVDHVVLTDQLSSNSNGFFLHRDRLDHYRSIGLLRSGSSDVI